MKAILSVVVGVLLAGGGWIIGSIYPAPEEITGRFRQEAITLLAQMDVSPETIDRLRTSLSADEFRRVIDNAAVLAATAGDALLIERDAQSAESVKEMSETADFVPPPQVALVTPAPAAIPKAPEVQASIPTLPGLAGRFEAARICGGMTVQNQPAVDAAGLVAGGNAHVDINGVLLAVRPVETGCLASGFGPRGRSVHKGIDYYSPSGGAILAAADGTVIEKKYRDDYGNMLLIDHGQGVYTRYAHLSSFAPGVAIGSTVKAGQQIGLMGNTAAYRIPVHLHYEVLVGDYGNPKGSFGLTPRSPFDGKMEG